MNLKSRIVKLEQATNTDHIKAITIYIKNPKYENKDGTPEIVSADCYLHKEVEAGCQVPPEDAEMILDYYDEKEIV